MATESAKRRQTLSILDQMRTGSMPRSAKYRNEWSGEELPEDEELTQDEFQKQRAVRTEQSLVNEMPEGVTKNMMGVVGDVEAGPTGMSDPGAANPGMVPYSPEEFERRSSMSPLRTGVEALDQPPAKKKRRKAMGSDIPADVNAEP